MPRPRGTAPGDALRENLLQHALRSRGPVFERLARVLGDVKGLARHDRYIKALRDGENVEVPAWKLAQALVEIGQSDDLNPSAATYIVTAAGTYREEK